MKLETAAVHAGDRKPLPSQIPVTTPIFSSSSFIAQSMEELDRVMGREEFGYCYARHENPSLVALENAMITLEGGHTAMACASGMAAIHTALLAALTDRRKHVLAANAIYGATQNQLVTVLSQLGIEATFVDICDLSAVQNALEKHRPGCVLMETVSNPLLRVGPMDEIARAAKAQNAALVVDSTFATPLLLRPMEHGANLVVHSATKYLSGHGDVLGGVIVSDAEHGEIVRALGRTLGPLMGPFESYLVMRGIKTFPLRVERQCQNAVKIAAWLKGRPEIERVYFTGDPDHPDAANIARLFPKDLYGAMISFELKSGAKSDVFAFMDRLKLVVKSTSLGDVHTMMLYPAMSSHRELSPKQRERLGIRESLVRLSVGIEAADDIIADLDQALSSGAPAPSAVDESPTHAL